MTTNNPLLTTEENNETHQEKRNSKESHTSMAILSSNKKESDARERLVDTVSVSMFSMILILSWKNFKQQCQRRKVAWTIKMLLPIIFTLILGAIRTAFTVDNEPTNYGKFLTTESMFINSALLQSNQWIVPSICITKDLPASLIAIVRNPALNNYNHINNVVQILNNSFQTIYNNISNPNITDDQQIIVHRMQSNYHLWKVG